MGIFDIFKSKQEERDLGRKVLKSEEVNRPAFQPRYFEDAQDAEAFDWNEQGILERNGEIITYGCYNDRMNQAVCRFAGKEKCEKVAKVNGWNADFMNDVVGCVCDKKGYPIDWYILHDALSKV